MPSTLAGKNKEGGGSSNTLFIKDEENQDEWDIKSTQRREYEDDFE